MVNTRVEVVRMSGRGAEIVDAKRLTFGSAITFHDFRCFVSLLSKASIDAFFARLMRVDVLTVSSVFVIEGEMPTVHFIVSVHNKKEEKLPLPLSNSMWARIGAHLEQVLKEARICAHAITVIGDNNHMVIMGSNFKVLCDDHEDCKDHPAMAADCQARRSS
jgi:hypothetical protein